MYERLIYAVHETYDGSSICAASEEKALHEDVDVARDTRAGGHSKHLRAYCSECDGYPFVRDTDGDGDALILTERYYAQ